MNLQAHYKQGMVDALVKGAMGKEGAFDIGGAIERAVTYAREHGAGLVDSALVALFGGGRGGSGRGAAQPWGPRRVPPIFSRQQRARAGHLAELEDFGDYARKAWGNIEAHDTRNQKTRLATMNRATRLGLESKHPMSAEDWV